MSYCVNPSCTNPKNPNNVQVCQNCGSSLRLRDRYHTLALLGKGGFGATFAAADLALPGTPYCVVKQLRPATDDPNIFRMAKQLFEREAQTLGKVGNHPQVPRLLDFFEENQQFYLVQEYVKGHNLHQEVRKNGPFSEAGVKQFLSEMLPILQYIHEQRVIHRDLKPANLIRRQTDHKMVLIDFGAVKNEVNTVLASTTSDQTALTNFAVGTMGFAPPEQMAMRPVYASDIYALGVTSIYLLTGKAPKDIGCDPQTGEIAWENYVKVDPSFAKVLKTMMELSVRHRYKSAEAVLQALDMEAYSDSLKNSVISMPTVTTINPSSNLARTDNSGMLSQNLGNSGTQTAMNAPVSGIRTDIRRHSQPVSSPSDDSVNLGGGGGNPAGGMDFQLVKGQVGSKRQSKASESTMLKKPKKLTAQGIIDTYAQGKRDFTQQELNDLNLSRANLPGIIFYQSQLTRVNLQGAELSRADFGRTNLQQAVLKNANLADAYLGYADLERADLRGANLMGANLKYANLRGTNLCGVDLSEAQVSSAQVALAKTNWRTVMPSGKRGFW